VSGTSTLHETRGHLHRRRWSTALAVVASGTLLLAACGGGDDDESESTNTAAESTDTDAADSESAGTDSTDLATTSSPTTSASTTTTDAGDFEYVTEGATVIVANASRVDGAAGRLTDSLVAVGYTTTDATNSSDDVENLEATQIFFVPGDAAAQAVAENLRLAFGGGDITVGEVADPAPTESGDLGEGTVLVLMGNDVAGTTLEELGSAETGDDSATDDEGDDEDDAGDDAATTEPPTTS